MDARATALSLAAGRIADSHLSKTCRPRLDVTSVRVVEKFKLQPSQ